MRNYYKIIENTLFLLKQQHLTLDYWIVNNSWTVNIMISLIAYRIKIDHFIILVCRIVYCASFIYKNQIETTNLLDATRDVSHRIKQTLRFFFTQRKWIAQINHDYDSKSFKRKSLKNTLRWKLKFGSKQKQINAKRKAVKGMFSKFMELNYKLLRLKNEIKSS